MAGRTGNTSVRFEHISVANDSIIVASTPDSRQQGQTGSRCESETGPFNQSSPGMTTGLDSAERRSSDSGSDVVVGLRTTGTVSMTVVPSRAEGMDSAGPSQGGEEATQAQSADARLGTKPHVINVSPTSSIPGDTTYLGHSLKKIRARDFQTTASKLNTESTEIKGLTCAVCLEVFNNPKFLPCHHTYCAACIEDLSRRRPNKPIKCPTCRKEVTLPSGGVNMLQHNFYIRPEDLEKAARGIVDSSKCIQHPQQDLDMFCTECEQVVCFKCLLTKHKEHSMQDLAEAAEEAWDQLSAHGTLLESVVSMVTEHVERQKKEQRYFELKMEKVRKNLINRHDTIVAAAKKFLKEGLETLDKVMEDVHEEVVKDAKFAQNYLNTLLKLQKSIEIAIKTKAHVEVVEADRDMRVGYGCRAAVDELLSQKRDSVYRPVLRFQAYAGTVLRAIRQFFGHVEMLEVTLNKPEMSVMEKFRCGAEYDTDVFSLCPKDNGALSLSYERRGLNEEAASEGLDEKGQHQYTRNEVTGMATWKSRGKGKGVFVGQLRGQKRTYSKGQSIESFLRLDNNLKGRADVKRETIVTESPYKSRLSKECTFKCGPHRGFDADVKEIIFAVVEETDSPDMAPRRVLLFTKNVEDPVCTYVPPSTLTVFQPTDVCFYLLGNNHVLLVADELNDAIHVVDYKDTTLNFRRFLVPGCPVLIQPTAVNVDATNRLWIACRGGCVLCMDQISSPIDQPAPSV